jgi:hypothetical protein
MDGQSPEPNSEWAFLGAAVIAVGVVVASTAALGGPDIEQITVTAPRTVERAVVGRSSSGMPMEEISLSRSVSLVGFDLKKAVDVARVEQLIDEAAEDNCKQLDSLYPLVTSDPRCVKLAADEAKHKLSELRKR